MQLGLKIRLNQNLIACRLMLLWLVHPVHIVAATKAIAFAMPSIEVAI